MAIPYGHHGLLFGAAGGGGVPIAGAKTILNFGGSDGATSPITDDTGNHTWTLTSAGGGAIDTAQSKFGGSSLELINSDRITAPSHADWAFGTGDFTVAGWARASALGGSNILFMVNVGNGLIVSFRSTGQLAMGYEGVAYDHQSATNISTGQWYHWEVGRSGTTAKGFIDGVQVFTGANTRNFAQGIASFGAKSGGSEYFAGHMDSCIVVKGSCLHTANFTPPAGPYSP